MAGLPAQRARHGSARVYRILLYAYPRAFREEYAAEMLLVFGEALEDAWFRQGWPGLLRLWGDMLCDFVKTVCIEHVKNWTQEGQGSLALAGKDHMAMALPFTLDFAQRTDIGLKRETNEDNLVAVVPEDQQLLQTRGALFVVSDGMGGHERGEVASQLTIQKVRDFYYHNTQDDIPTALQTAIEQANRAILAASAQQQTREAKSMMGATCVAAVVHDQTLYAANVGDSRVYVLHDGQLRQVTRDHSWVRQAVEKGEITPEEARTHEKRNIIYRSLGTPEVEVDLFTEPVQEGDTLILCTDGLSGVMLDAELQSIVEHHAPAVSVQQLITRANEEGGPDNVTAIVVRLESKRSLTDAHHTVQSK
ncbi:MAG TPA: Stp1/IreP family PP2C-type Ser/Thr phosphatase [Ktedonobacteraceae bacterium]|nr:Stp1/IreP family PP2C-type Ser/Thr phosphatase [Ktedonobacteraceae bacterium]